MPTEIKTQTEKDPVKKEKKPKRREDNEEEKKVEVKGDQKKLNKRKHKRMKYQWVYHPPFLTKMPINVDKEVQKHSTFSIFSSKIKNSIFGMNGEDADRLMRVDETELDLSNQDVILAKPGWLVKKSWRIKNIGIKEWPKGTKIVSVTDGLFYHPPKITNLLRPGEVMDIGIRIYIPKEEKDEGNLKEYIMRLYWEQLKWFGEPLIATIQVDSQLYDQISKTLPKNSDEYEYPRVTEDLKYVENYQSAKEMSEQKQIPFRKCLKQILQGNTI